MKLKGSTLSVPAPGWMSLWLLDKGGAGYRVVGPTEVERRRHEVDLVPRNPVSDMTVHLYLGVFE